MQLIRTELSIFVRPDLSLDAGSLEETEAQWVVTPPDRSMIDQLIDYLDAQSLPKTDGVVRMKCLSVGFTALCVRWGSYLATLMDDRSEPHPAVASSPKAQPDGISLINDSEMRRLNIEISANVARLVQIFRERHLLGFYDLLRKAYVYLPMPHKFVPPNRHAAIVLLTHLSLGEHFPIAQPTLEVPIAEADRALANMIVCNAWRNGYVEELHAGISPSSPLKPHQQRFTRNDGLHLIRSVTTNLSLVPDLMPTLFDPEQTTGPFPPWPRNATALANTLYGQYGYDWSRTESSAPVILRK